MKRWILSVAILTLALTGLPAQDIDLQLAVVTQSLNEPALERLGVPSEDISAILGIQAEFRRLKEESAVELNVLKAQIARHLYYPDADTREVERLLERASEIRLEQERAQLRAYLQVRERIGEENWLRLTEQIRTQVRQRQSTTGSSGQQNRSRPATGGANSR